MFPVSVPTVNLKRKFLADEAEVALDLSAPAGPQLMAALRSGGPIPAGDLVLGSVKANAGGGHTVRFGGDAKGTVAFSGHAEAAFALGVYADAADAIRAAAPAAELAEGLSVDHPAATRFLVLGASYDIAAAAKGSLALGTGASATFGASGSSAGRLAVLHRFGDAEPAVQVFGDLFASWGLPRQIARAEDLAPGTWLIAEVDGSIALQVGVQAGYDFSWLREIPGGALKGDIGLRIQLGAKAALGFEASGKYALVLARESDERAVRLRLFKMARKGWTFAFDARAGIKAQLPPFFDQPHTAEDLVAAIFGLNGNQVIEVLRETRAFVNSNVSLQDKLAGVLMELGGTAIEHAARLNEGQIRDIYEAGRKKLVDFLSRFDGLSKTGGHDLTSMLLSLAGEDTASLRTVLQTIAGTDGGAALQNEVRALLAKAGFEATPAGRFIEAAVGPALGLLTNTEIGKKLKSIASDALALLDGDAFQTILDFMRRELSLDKVLAVKDATDFDGLTGLLRSRLAAFLGKQTLLMADLNRVQNAIKALLAQGDKFVNMAIQAAKQKQEFAFTARYARSTTASALVDISFDTDTAADFLAKAIHGDLNEILLEEKPGVTLHAAELTHGIARNVSSEMTMPFGTVEETSELLSTASLSVQEDNGRVLVYSLDASSKESERRSLFKARSGRDSSLTVAAVMPIAAGGGVRRWKEDSYNYSYRMERATRRMRAVELREEIGPLVAKYVPSAFSTPGARTLDEWVGDLDKLLDDKDPSSGTHDIGDTLITLTLSAPPGYLRAWTGAPKERSHPLYMRLSLALQARLKELVSFYYFSDPARYTEVAAAAAPIVYAAIPVSTTVALTSDGALDKFNTDKGIHWDQADMREVRAMVGARNTATALAGRLEKISAILRGIPELSGSAAFYAPDEMENIVAASLKRVSPGAMVPEALGSLLFLEARLVETAVDAGIEMAAFRDLAAANPAIALKHLASFGEELLAAFNQTLGQHAVLDGASRALATLLFLDAAAVFDPSLAGAVAAFMDITVIRSGRLSPKEMLGGKITPDLILYEQPFVQG